MKTSIEMCCASQCPNNDKGMCTLLYVTLDEEGKCDFWARKMSLEETLKPKGDPRP